MQPAPLGDYGVMITCSCHSSMASTAPVWLERTMITDNYSSHMTDNDNVISTQKGQFSCKTVMDNRQVIRMAILARTNGSDGFDDDTLD